MNFTLKSYSANFFFQTLRCRSRLWEIEFPSGETRIFDSKSIQIIPETHTLDAFLAKHKFACVREKGSQRELATFDRIQGLLWTNNTSPYEFFGDLFSFFFGGIEKFDLAEGKKHVDAARNAGLEGWRLPAAEELVCFATPGNPHFENRENLLLHHTGQPVKEWLTDRGAIDIEGPLKAADISGCIFACHPLWAHNNPELILADLILYNWDLASPDNEVFSASTETRWNQLPPEELLEIWKTESYTFRPIYSNSSSKLGYWEAIENSPLIEIDYTPCRLPKLGKLQLTDPDNGLWELWTQNPTLLKNIELVARDPSQDVRRQAIAIDFGTSSTVIAGETSNGGRELLRIGVRDFYQTIQPKDFENPTVLECLDFPAFHAAWTAAAYRPELNWDWMRAAHEAQESYRDNKSDTQVLASIFPRLKQWALRSDRSQINFSDRQGNKIEVSPLSVRNPVMGQPLSVSDQDPFDPIELYAWYLGMAINWRGRGLFLKYYLSFPVKYEREVKDAILASFRRGLQRSLPRTLVEQPGVLNELVVRELASEPAAYAAAALPHLGIEPTDEGVPYAVFDFGGGTTDFDFGLLRWADDEEDAEGYERTFEHLASSGDNYLGGENLLEHLVYESFRHNLDTLRENRIQFTQPLDAQPFAGSEAFLTNTQAAQTNSVMLAAELRPFMEDQDPDLPAQIKLDLIDADGNKTLCELALDTQALDRLLAGRVRRGVEAFLAELARVRRDFPASAPIHVLLAGNGCRSRYIGDLFDTESESWSELLANAFGEAIPEIIVHAPLPMNEQAPQAPTAKTGVALGLLQVVPGRNVRLKNRVHAEHGGQAPFGWFVGRLRRGRLEPVLFPDSTYREWQQLGLLQEQMFHLYASNSPRARTGLPAGDAELMMHPLDFPGTPEGARLFARAWAPNVIELVASLEIPTQESPGSIKQLTLG